MISRLGAELVIVRRPDVVVDTRDNSKVLDFSSPTDTPYEGCSVQPFRMSNKLVTEDNVGREFARQFFRFWMPPGADVLFTDRLLWRALEMDVWAQDGPWFDLEGNADHIQLLGLLREG